MAWHLDRRYPDQCSAAFDDLEGQCSNKSHRPNCSQHSEKCSNIIDVCFGPLNATAEADLLSDEQFTNVTRAVGALYDPSAYLQVANAAFAAVNNESLSSLLEVSSAVCGCVCESMF